MMTRYSLRAALVALCIFAAPQLSSAQAQRVVTLLEGDVSSTAGGKATGVQVSIKKGTEKVNATKTTGEGKFTAVLQPNATYRVIFESPDYFYKEETLTVPALEKYAKTPLNVSLRPLRSGAFDINSAVFAPKSADIQQSAVAELEQIAEALKHNPRLTIAVNVYPDAVVKSKKDDSQQKLVAARASAITSFFLSRGFGNKNVSVNLNQTVPTNGKFEMTMTEVVKKKTVTKKVMVPQYVEIVGNVNG